MERLQKFMARRGIASRRAAEQMILEGRVEVNGSTITRLGIKIDPESDHVKVDGRTVPREKTPRVLMLNKPSGVLSTSKTGKETGPTILDFVPRDRRYFSVGRLDKNSTGLLLITDDGDLAYQLTHPKFGTEKEYLVETRERLTDDQLDQLTSGVNLDDGIAAAARLKRAGPKRIRIVLREGRNRQIRRMIAAVGGRVTRLVRVRFAGLTLGELKEGKWRALTSEEINSLRKKHPS
jgi:pseudouridine synthase